MQTGSILAAYAANDETIDNCQPSINFDYLSLGSRTVEYKRLCNATNNDDFEDDAILVMFNNKASLQFNNYNVNSFDSIGVVSVEQSETNNRVGNKIKKYLSQETSAKAVLKSDNINVVNSNIDKETIQKYNQIIKLRLNKHSKQNVLDMIKLLEKREDVILVQPNYYYNLTKIPNDTMINDENYNWAINKISLPSAWNVTTGSKNVKIGVLDSGIDNTHPDLSNNVNSNIKYSYKGIKPFFDVYNHGSSVAGIIGAVGNNSNGIAGVCWDVDLISLKNLDNSNTISSAVIYEAFEYAQDNNIDIINCSFGSYKQDSLIEKAIDDYDGLVICSAGNNANNNDNVHHYPSDYNYDNIISVAATDKNDNLASFSNYGKTSIDLAAPGDDILTTICKGRSYEIMDGTSFSAPFVTGVAALIKSIYPTITAQGIKMAILDGVDKLDSLTNKVQSGGRLNAFKALQSAQEHIFKISYNKNGGTGTTMNNTIITYGVPTKLSANTYTHSAPASLFAGWYVYRTSDNKWLYKKGIYSNWYVEGTQPTGYTKATISDFSYAKNDTVILYARWLSKSDIILGDVNCDEKVTVADVSLLQRYLANQIELNEIQLFAADVDKNGKITSADITALQHIISTQ